MKLFVSQLSLGCFLFAKIKSNLLTDVSTEFYRKKNHTLCNKYLLYIIYNLLSSLVMSNDVAVIYPISNKGGRGPTRADW